MISGSLLLVMLGACHPAPPPDYGPVRVIATFNLSGSDAVLDVEAFNGARIAARQINDRGGVNGRNLELIPIDTASNVPIAVAAVERALDDESDVVAGIGYCDSSFADEVGILFQRARIPFVSPGATDPKIPTIVGDEMFLAAYGDDAQARAMAEYASGKLGLRRVAVWYDETEDYPETLSKYFTASFEKRGGKVELHSEPPRILDFSAFLDVVRAARPPFDGIFGATMPAQAAAFVEQTRAAGFTGPLLSGDGWDDPRIVELSENKDISGIYFTTHHFLDVETSEMKAFVAAYQATYGRPPDNAFAALGFDAVGLLADAMKRAGSSQPEKVRAALATTMDYPGIVGPISYRDGSRVPIKPVTLIEIRDGQKSVAWTGTP